MIENNKPIIIDGVDVSGCEDYGYRGKAGYWCHNYDEPCTDYPNCLFKQLSRKTQECEELKEKYKWFNYYKEQALFNKNLCNKKSDKIDQLKAENEQIKKYLGISSKTIMERLEELQEFRDRDRDKLYQAEQKLERIRDIAGYEFKELMNAEDYHNMTEVLEQILQIIDEVE